MFIFFFCLLTSTLVSTSRPGSIWKWFSSPWSLSWCSLSETPRSAEDGIKAARYCGSIDGQGPRICCWPSSCSGLRIGSGPWSPDPRERGRTGVSIVVSGLAPWSVAGAGSVWWCRCALWCPFWWRRSPLWCPLFTTRALFGVWRATPPILSWP